MGKDRKTTDSYIVDIKYKYSINKFSEVYGDGVSYQEIEQRSYVDLKQMAYEMISEKIKFRKYERSGMALRLKVDMTKEECERFNKLKKENLFYFVYDYEISNIEPLKK